MRDTVFAGLVLVSLFLVLSRRSQDIQTCKYFVKSESYVCFYFMYIHIDILERCTGHICINNPLDSLYDTTLVQALQAIRYKQEIGSRFETTRNDDYLPGIYFVKYKSYV